MLMEAFFVVLNICCWTRLRVAGDAPSFATILQEDSPLAEGADPGEVTKDGVDLLFKETDALGSR
jgi:hypothetical protein